MASVRILRVGFTLLSTTLAATTLALSACSGGGGGSGDGSEKLVQDFSACDSKPDVGASAIAGNASKTDWVLSKYFAKPYDRYDLEAVVNASSTSTTNYVRSLGIDMYKVPRTNMAGQCPTYFNLPKAPAATYQKIWDSAAGGNTGNGKLAGLFFEYCGTADSPMCRGREMVQPVILLDEASDRWTLVHEMMHYNFNQGRKADTGIKTTGELNRALNTTAAQLKKALEDYDQMPSRQDLQVAVDSLAAWVDLGKQIAVRRALEEVTIEATLIDEWAAGRLKNIHSDSPRSGVWYMNFSRDQYLATLNAYDPIIAKIKTAADANFWSEISSQVDDVYRAVDDSRAETKEIIEGSKNKIKRITNSNDDTQFLRAPKQFGAIDKVGSGQPAANDSEFISKTGEVHPVTGGRSKTRFSMSKPVSYEDAAALAAAKAHAETHDDGGLSKSFEALTLELANSVK